MIFGGMMLRLRLLFCSLSLLRLSRMYVSRIDALPFLKKKKEKSSWIKGEFFVGEWEMLTEDFLVLVIFLLQVTQLGIGRDVWTLTPENIEKALKVSEWVKKKKKFQHFLSLPLSPSLVSHWPLDATDVLRRRNPLHAGNAHHQNRHFMHLSPHLHQHQIQTTRLRHHWLKRCLRDCFFPHYHFSMHACQECMFDPYPILT